MEHLKAILRFGEPYLKRYWHRMALGILLGVLYGLSNGAAIWGARMVFERLAPPAPALQPGAAPGTSFPIPLPTASPQSKVGQFRQLATNLDQSARDALDPGCPGPVANPVGAKPWA